MIYFLFLLWNGTIFTTADLSLFPHQCPHHFTSSSANTAATPQLPYNHHYRRRNTCRRWQIITTPGNTPHKYWRCGSISAATAPYLSPRLYCRCCTATLVILLTKLQLLPPHRDHHTNTSNATTIPAATNKLPPPPYTCRLNIAPYNFWWKYFLVEIIFSNHGWC